MLWNFKKYSRLARPIFRHHLYVFIERRAESTPSLDGGMGPTREGPPWSKIKTPCTFLGFEEVTSDLEQDVHTYKKQSLIPALILPQWRKGVERNTRIAGYLIFTTLGTEGLPGVSDMETVQNRG